MAVMAKRYSSFSTIGGRNRFESHEATGPTSTESDNRATSTSCRHKRYESIKDKPAAFPQYKDLEDAPGAKKND
ncbi:hypothetical protein KIN20_032875 [Parelaphostrongylus tenuis]|uniref:Uncharacterized protein n=1 Tax=Parelaphostrongylus tenuis TaxID=148309 RepID=A0AAD5WHT1_PARTN|nr:hypothetical protein KIN20_032875 [Parelaphostrongylus tenuis]